MITIRRLQKNVYYVWKDDNYLYLYVDGECIGYLNITTGDALRIESPNRRQAHYIKLLLQHTARWVSAVLPSTLASMAPKVHFCSEE